MVGPRDVVADRLGRVAAEKNRPGMMHPLGQCVGLVERELEMLGRDPVDQRRRLLPIGDDQDGAMRLPAGSRDLRPRQVRQVALHRRLDRGRKTAIVAVP